MLRRGLLAFLALSFLVPVGTADHCGNDPTCGVDPYDLAQTYADATARIAAHALDRAGAAPERFGFRCDPHFDAHARFEGFGADAGADCAADPDATLAFLLVVVDRAQHPEDIPPPPVPTLP